ncbi:MAG: universal stress protein, partial [Propionibacteriaceae bacterium]|nr:universal stress protein [Propionibacteriaceae bacterium]
MGRIIVGYDGSEDAVAALEYAVAEALARQSSLALVYAVDDTVLNSVWGVVFDPDEIKSDAAAMMGEAVAQAAKLGMPAEKVRAEVVLGDPAAALSKLSPRADLVVLGRCSVGKGVSEFVGSTAVGVAGASECPVVVVSANNHRPEIPFGRVGVGVHIAAKGRVGLPVALAEARRRGAAVSVISVVKATQSRWRAASLTDEQQQQAM